MEKIVLVSDHDMQLLPFSSENNGFSLREGQNWPEFSVPPLSSLPWCLFSAILCRTPAATVSDLQRGSGFHGQRAKEYSKRMG